MQRKHRSRIKSGIFIIPIILLCSPLINSCRLHPTESFKGHVTKEFVRTNDGHAAIEYVMELEDRILFLEFSDNTRFDDKMKSLPYPQKNGFYEIPEGEGGGSLMLKNGKIVYFRDKNQYVITGTTSDIKKADFLPLLGSDKDAFLFHVKKMYISQTD